MTLSETRSCSIRGVFLALSILLFSYYIQESPNGKKEDNFEAKENGSVLINLIITREYGLGAGIIEKRARDYLDA